jgi:hypothetical protein
MRIVFVIVIVSLLSTSLSYAQTPGCTDPLANNFEASATLNDGSCLYPPLTLSPTVSLEIDDALSEISGMICWNGIIWAHNDDTDTDVHRLEPAQADYIDALALQGVANADWEEISQDENYVYIGDFGNNVSGNRTDLKILRIEKESLLQASAQIDTIAFSYADQVDFSPQNNNETNFDCEAFVVSEDSIYLFTKQWINFETSVYAISKSPGEHIAEFKTSFDVNGLVTGACYFENEQLLALCGYSSNLLQPFIYLLYDFTGQHFFSGNKRKVNIDLLIHQIEGICSEDRLIWYLSNEHVVQKPFININAKLHTFNLENLLGDYLSTANAVSPLLQKSKVYCYPNPAVDFITIHATQDSPCSIYSLSGTKINCRKSSDNQINVAHLLPGYYILIIDNNSYIFNKL